MLDIIAKVLIMSFIFTVLGLIIHSVNYVFNKSYRKEIMDKKTLKKQINEFLILLNNINEREVLLEKISVTNSVFNFSLNNYKEFVSNIYEKDLKKFPVETTLFTLINASIYAEKEYELKNCLNDLIKKNKSEEINTELKFGIEIIKKQAELKGKNKNNSYEFIIYNTYRLMCNSLLKKMRLEFNIIKENLMAQDNNFIVPNFDHIIDRLSNEIEFGIFIKELIRNNKSLEEAVNLSIMINAYEKVSINLTEDIKNLTKIP
jgi:hypothetical protein